MTPDKIAERDQCRALVRIFTHINAMLDAQRLINDEPEQLPLVLKLLFRSRLTFLTW